MNKKADFLDRIHTPLQKALKIGETTVGIAATLKGIYDVGSKIYQGFQAAAPIASALL